MCTYMYILDLQFYNKSKLLFCLPNRIGNKCIFFSQPFSLSSLFDYLTVHFHLGNSTIENSETLRGGKETLLGMILRLGLHRCPFSKTERGEEDGKKYKEKKWGGEKGRNN